MRLSLIALYCCVMGIYSPVCQGSDAGFERIPNGVIFRSPGLSEKVVFYGPGMVRILKWTPGGTEKKTSLSVVMRRFIGLKVRYEEAARGITLRAEGLRLTIWKPDGRITFSDTAGAAILKETGCGFVPVAYGSDSAFSVRQGFELTPEEGVYGLGEHQSGQMNYRGKTVTMVQSNTEDIVPFLISTRNYGILWDNYSKSVYADDGAAVASLWSDVGDNIDYYFIAAGSMDGVIRGYRALTGDAPMYGKWAYGYWQSKEHYKTSAEVLQVAAEYRKRGIPIDNIIQDWDYWNGAEHWSGMFFDKTLFPDPGGMIRRLHDMHFHFMISIWPALGQQTEIYRDMLRHRFLYSPVGWGGFRYYDAFRPAANALYWKYLKRGILSQGVDALWIDSTEPDLRNANTKESTDYEMKRVEDNFLGSWARYMNAYSLAMTSDIYSSWRKEIPGKRCYILTRSTFAGQQRNAATTWTGDIGAGWDIYRHQISAGINHGMSGVPYWTFDIGGFVLGAYEGVFSRGGKDPAYQELYARMFQLGAFSPIFRSHGSETPREVWEMGEFVEPLVQADRLRYRLLPYIYSLAWKVTDEGYTIMRGLPMDFPGDRKTYGIDNQFMFGPALLVCPVTEYMYHRPPEQSVLVGPGVFSTGDGKPGLRATYYRDKGYKDLSREQIDPNIDFTWYTGRPDYLTDSMYSARWKGKLTPPETGVYQFHLKSYDAKRLYIDGRQLPIVYTSVEQITDTLTLAAGKSYDFTLETENTSTGAAKMRLFWKTPSVFARENIVEERPKTWPVYLPEAPEWFDFWTGTTHPGGEQVQADAPIRHIPLFVRAGAIIPMGPFLMYSTEKPADTLEVRVYPGADGKFVLYEDENDNYNYEKGVRATIEFRWDDARRTLTIGRRIGTFPGMLQRRTIEIVIVSKDHGSGIERTARPDRAVQYSGREMVISF